MTGRVEEGDRVALVECADLRAGEGNWCWADAHREEIEAHWQRRTAENPSFFNGTIFVLKSHEVRGGTLGGTLIPVEFKSFLYWKDSGYPDRSVRDCFGSALIRSSEGHVLLGRQRPGNINTGLAYLPGGFIDRRDVGADGGIDIAASIAREVAEETGLGAGELRAAPGFRLSYAGPMLSIAKELRSELPAEELRTAIASRLAADPQSELEDVVVVRGADDMAALAMPVYTRLLLGAVLGLG